MRNSINRSIQKRDEWLAAGRLIPKAFLILLTAPPGGFKTWFALAFAGAVSQGTEFLGRKTSQVDVLYLDLENPLSVIKQRRAILKLDDNFYLKFWGNWLPDSPPMIGDSRLEEFAEDQDLLIIFDSFLRFHDAEENNAKQMAKVFAKLHRLTKLRRHCNCFASSSQNEK